MIKLYCKSKNEVAVVSDQASVIDIYRQEDDGILISIQSPMANIEAIVKNLSLDSRDVYKAIMSGEFYDVDDIYVSDENTEVVDEEYEDLEEGKDGDW